MKTEGKFIGAAMSAIRVRLRRFEAKHGRVADLHDLDDAREILDAILQEMLSRGWRAEPGHRARSEAAVADAVAQLMGLH
jgi:hypothetical protein